MHEFDARGSASLTYVTSVRYARYLTYYRISLVFIEFEARISGLSLKTKIFIIRKKGQSHIWRRASALPKNQNENVK